MSTVGRWQIQLADRLVRSSEGTEQLQLTPTEWKLLEILVQNPGKLVSQRQLLQEVCGPQSGSETNYLRQYMAQLRHKLEDDPSHPRHLLTEPGMVIGCTSLTAISPLKVDHWQQAAPDCEGSTMRYGRRRR